MISPDLIAAAARRIGVSADDLAPIIAQGAEHAYRDGQRLFSEGAPRTWIGIVTRGEVRIQRGAYGRSTLLETLGVDALLGEGLLLDDGPHSSSALAQGETAVWQIPRAALDRVRADDPLIYYRIVAQIARRIGDRLRLASARIADEAGVPRDGARRVEHDLLGEREVPEWAYYGIQTLRGVENFPLSGIPISQYRHFVRALAMVKKAAAQTNAELGVLSAERADAIARACDEIIAGALHSHFVVDLVQGGAGTSTNMNANEVIANRALEILGRRKGDYAHLHPNDHVNCSQSTNDAYPTAVKLGVVLTLGETLGALRELQTALLERGRAFADVLKMGRTENQDAVPMTLGQEFHAYATMIGDGIRRLERAGDELLATNMGATAIGTGLNSPPGYAARCTQHLAAISGLRVRLAEDLVEATQDAGAFALMSGTLKSAAVQLSKICNDLRWLSSGPRCGLGEIRLPAMQPGSSIMPGKVNPVIPEVVNQVCYQLIGMDMTVTMASEASELELNMAEPIIAFNLLFGLTLLRNAATVLATRCIAGIEADRERCAAYVRNAIGLVTALNPVLGYEKSAAIAKEALATGGSVYDLVLAKGWLSRERLDALLAPERMTGPG